MKKYCIHILAVTAFRTYVIDEPYENIALIVCTDRCETIVNKLMIRNKLIINFPDVEDENYPGAFNRLHARMIIQFLKGLPHNITDLYICCSKGGSRSPAVAAALLRKSRRNDNVVLKNPYYVPNTLVYRVLCRELHMYCSKRYVAKKNAKNIKAFKKAVKTHGNQKYERWELIE